MFNLEKITKIQSIEAERVLEFYRIQEELCEEAPLALWRNGAKTKGSDIHVELKLLTDKARTTYSRNVSGQSPKEESNNQLNSQQTSAEANSESDHSSQSKDKQQNKTKVEDLPEEQNNQKQLVLWEKIFGGKGLRVIFKGGAGSGKSFSLTQEIRKRISKAKSELENFRHTIHEVELPIFVKASAFISSSQENIVDVILEQISGLSDSANLGSWFRNAFESENGKRLFIVIDGLDELPETAQRIFRDRTKQLEDKLKSASLVVSCRTMYFDDRRDWISWATDRRTKVIELAPLEEKQQIELIEKLNQNINKSNHTLIGLVKNNLSLNHFCKTPLIMASACWLYSEGELSEDTTYSSLYKALTKKILRGDWKELENRPKWVRSKSNVQRDADLTDRTELLSHICWQLFEASSSENRFTLKQWREAFDKTPKRFKKKKLSATKLLKELEMVGMIINAGYDSDHNPCYSFVHRTILEYFAAVGLVNHSDESFYVRTIVKHLWCEKEWFEVIRFVASIIEDPTMLLKSVAKETGKPVAPSRPLQKLAGICDGISGFIIFFLVAFSIISGLVIYNSETVSGKAGKYLSQSGQFLKIIGERFVDNLKTFLETPNNESKSITTFITDLFFLFAQEIQKIYLSLSKLVSVLYNAFFELLYILISPTGQETEYQQSFLEKIRFCLEWIEYLIPYFVLLLLFLWISEAVLNWLDKKILYRLFSQKQDDIFRTGLRVQAEIVGHNNKASEKDVARISNELLESEITKSLNIYGAGEKGCIPEDLLLIVGSNSVARRILNIHWLNVINKRSRSFEKFNKIYSALLSIHIFMLVALRWVISRVQKTEKSFLLNPRDFREIQKFGSVLTNQDRDSYETQLLSTFLTENFSSELLDLLKDRYSEKSHEKIKSALSVEFNKVIQNQFIYDEKRFSRIKLRTETRYLLNKKPTGQELIRLNRLLLEDAYPQLKKFYGFWLRFLIGVGRIVLKYNLCSLAEDLRSLDQRPDLYRALRGLSLIPDFQNSQIEDCLENLSNQALITSKHLKNGGFSRLSFNRLDIHIAKTLGAINKIGRINLNNFASKLDEENGWTPLAIKELSIFEPQQAVKLAATCLKNEWRDHWGDKYKYDQEFRDVLISLPNELVITELAHLSAEEDIGFFDKVLLPILQLIDKETAKTWLQKTANDVTNETLSKAANNALNYSWNKKWLDSEAWFDERILEINKFVSHDNISSATEEFESLITYYWDHTFDVLSKTPEKFNILCNEKILKYWYEKRGYHYSSGLNNLISFNRETPNPVLERLLFESIDNTDFNYIDGDGFSRKETLLLALGDLRTEYAEKSLINILQESRKIKNRYIRWSNDGVYDKGLFYDLIIVGLGKSGTNNAFQEILRVNKNNWISNYITARLLSERDDPKALELFLEGQRKKGEKEHWDTKYGDEPNLREMALKFGARITKVNHRGFPEYVAVSESRNFKFRMRA